MLNNYIIFGTIVAGNSWKFGQVLMKEAETCEDGCCGSAYSARDKLTNEMSRTKITSKCMEKLATLADNLTREVAVILQKKKIAFIN